RFPVSVGAATPANTEARFVRKGSAFPSPEKLARLLLNWRWAQRSRERAGIARTLRSLQRMKLRSAKNPARTMGSLMYAYKVVRAFRSTDDDCLNRSLALTRTARALGLDARICFGVRKEPFRAHAWVEWEDKVLNETVDGVSAYRVAGRF